MARNEIRLVTTLRDRWRELRRRWRIAPTVKARARHRCEGRIPDLCTYWGKEFHQIVSPPSSVEEIVYACLGCQKFLRDNPEWAAAKGLKRSAT
jgi:hypothetical protein